jgi:DNA-binding SARP family transcriptional activator/WD40 repeat protein/tRNA A-37 threonylcarbamoyl transferase component Bud32
MQVRVLGSVGIVRAGEEAALGPRLQRLLAALVARRGSVVPVDSLVDVVWQGEPPASAETTLRSYVTRLRAALDGDGHLLTHRQSGYVLDEGAVDLDADRFERELDDARIAFSTSDLAAAAELLESAMARWSGVPYGTFADEDWARPECVRLEERHTEAVELLAEVMLADGRVDQAIGLARSLIEEHPLRERPRELLMRATYIDGRKAEAVRVFRDYRELLAAETGLDPSAELAALEGRILVGELPRAAPPRRARGYELGEPLGRGAFAIVHRAVQPGVGRDVAIKIVRAELADQPDFVRRFDHEAQLVAAVEHPHVVPLYDFWREPGAAYLVMRLMRGGNLAQLLRDRGPLSRDQFRRVLDEVGGALHAAHRAGVLHRDVRPANLLRDDDGATYLADFGIAAGLTVALSDRPVHYAAPEVLRSGTFDVTTDIHSLGVTVFELLTGRLPLSDTTTRSELIRRQLDEPVPSVRATRSDLAPSVDDVLARATSKAAGDRYPSVPEFVDDLLAALGTPARTGATSLAAAPNPYLGLHAFTEADADRFHGREHLVGELADAVEHHRLVVAVGPSGCGKSSVVRAGLIPALRRGAVTGSDRWFITTMFPGDDPIDAFETALLRVAVNPPTSLRHQLAEDGGLLRAVRRVLPDDDSTVLLVIDQFEELFTLVSSEDVRRRFLDELAHAIDSPDSPLRVVATLRADHYDAPLADPALAQLVTDGTVTVRPMRTDELEQAIVRPARDVGVEVETTLVAELVAGVSHRPAALPLLQFALTELYERRVAGVMLLETHHALGGLAGALAARAERIIERGDERDEALIRRIFGRLVSFADDADGDARRRARLSEFGDDERTTWLIDELVAARLLVVDRDDDTREPTLEVAHEALLRDWPRLGRWIDEDRTDLRVHRIVTDAAGDWAAADHDEGTLARGGRLELVSDLAIRRADLLNDAERAWIDASIAADEERRDAEAAAVERERRQNRRLRRSLVAATALLVIAVATASIALVLRDRASANEQVARARELILEAEQSLADDPELGMLLALEAIDAYRSVDGDVPVSAVSVLRQGIAADHVRLRVPGGGWVVPLPGRAAFATADGQGGIAMWDTTSGEQIGAATIDGWDITYGWADGETLVVAGSDAAGDGALFTVDSPTGGATRLAPEIDIHPPTTDTLLDRDLLADVSSPGTLTIMRLSDGEVLRTYEVAAVFAELHIEPSGVLSFPTGSDADPGVAIVDVASWTRRDVTPTAFVAEHTSVSADGRYVALARKAGEVAVYEIDTGRLVWTAPPLTRAARPVWSRDGSRLLVGGEGDLAVLDGANGELVTSLDLHRGGTWSYALLDGSDSIVTADIAATETLLVDLDGGSEVAGSSPVRPDIDGAWGLHTLADGGLVVTSSSDYAIVRDGRIQVIGHGANVDGLGRYSWTVPVVHPTGYVTLDDGRSHLVDTRDGRVRWTAPSGWSIIAIAPDGMQVAIHQSPNDAVGTTKLVDLGSGTDRVLSDGDPWATAKFSTDGELVAITSTVTGEASLWHRDGRRIAPLAGSDNSSGLDWAFTSDGSAVAVGTWYGDAIVLDLAELVDGVPPRDAELNRIDAHDNLITAITYSPDDRLIATAAQDEPARVWDAATGELVGEFGSDEPGTAISFHPSEPWVHVLADGEITTHTLDTDALIDTARDLIDRQLTAAECERYLRRPCEA